MEAAADHELDLTDFAPVRFLIKDKTLASLRGGILAGFIALIGVTLFLPDHVAGVDQQLLGLGRGGAVSGAALSPAWPRIVLCLPPVHRRPYGEPHMEFCRNRRPGLSKSSSPFLIPLGLVLIAWSEHVFHMTDPSRGDRFSPDRPDLFGSFFRPLYLSGKPGAAIVVRWATSRVFFSLAATLFVRSNPNVCSTKCTTHDCNKGSDQYAGCPVFHHPLFARNAHICKLCFNCLKSCPHGSARLYLRPPLVRIWQQTRHWGNHRLFLPWCAFFWPPVCWPRSESLF